MTKERIKELFGEWAVDCGITNASIRTFEAGYQAGIKDMMDAYVGLRNADSETAFDKLWQWLDQHLVEDGGKNV